MVDFDKTNNSLMFMFFQGVSGCGCDVINYCVMCHCYYYCSIILATLWPIMYIANCSRWKSFAVSTDRLVLQNFSSEIACAIGLGHARLPSNHECFPVDYSLVLQPWNFFTSNDCSIWYVYRWLSDVVFTNIISAKTNSNFTIWIVGIKMTEYFD